MLPNSVATCCAVFSSRARESSSLRSALANTFLAEVPACARPTRAPSRASLLLRRHRDRSMIAFFTRYLLVLPCVVRRCVPQGTLQRALEQTRESAQRQHHDQQLFDTRARCE